jgi:hypothetical protein
MKTGISPVWEHDENKDGCAVSFLSSDTDTWKELSMALVGNQFLLDDGNTINGISRSPKRNNTLFKMWMKTPVDPVLSEEYQFPEKLFKKKIYTEDKTFTK